MTTESLNRTLKNPRTTCTRIAELMREYNFTADQAVLAAQHPRAETELLQNLWDEFCEDPDVAATIARRGRLLNSRLLSDIAETLMRNLEAWEEQYWEYVMDAFRDTIRTEFLTQYYDLLHYTFLETEDDDDEDFDEYNRDDEYPVDFATYNVDDNDFLDDDNYDDCDNDY